MKRRWWAVLLKFVGFCTHEAERIRSDGKVECLDCTRQRPLPREWIADTELAAVMENMQRMEQANRRPKEVTPEELLALRQSKKGKRPKKWAGETE